MTKRIFLFPTLIHLHLENHNTYLILYLKDNKIFSKFLMAIFQKLFMSSCKCDLHSSCNINVQGLENYIKLLTSQCPTLLNFHTILKAKYNKIQWLRLAFEKVSILKTQGLTLQTHQCRHQIIDVHASVHRYDISSK